MNLGQLQAEADLELAMQCAARCVVPLFSARRLIGTGFLVHRSGVTFLYTAYHVLFEEDGSRVLADISFGCSPLMLERVPALATWTFKVEPGVSIGRSAESDAIVIPLSKVTNELAALLREFSIPSSVLLAVEPATFSTRHVNIFLVGYPEETAYIDEKNTILGGIIYGSGEHPDQEVMDAARAAEPDRFVSWIADADENIDLITKDTYDVPALNCASGGPWMIVDHEPAGPRVRVIAMHSRRRIFEWSSLSIVIAYGVPVARHIGITLLSYLR